MKEQLCDIRECDFPASECMIPDHPKYCGEHLEEWYRDIVKRINDEQMVRNGYPDHPGV